ncbi:MAG: gfo/Idh/MocA family oxidoreductase [Candidatus Lokiarchaeota archaeon]|nr:gfo/Idh/MocA family oxidoreductase [Candidatus Lokiarchaeota archaeon]MBD3199962.1 gfo/Idh/MocA family oxidoreductase [Candidatus Lokiarchaeota archaeon]
MKKNTNKSGITAVLVGAGARGKDAYGKWALKNKDKIRFVAVAEPIQERREIFANEWNIPIEYQFSTWVKLLNDKVGTIADACLVCTQDQMHTAPALKALELGYHVLLEKPMATSEENCKKLVQKSEEMNKQLRICHVARYTTLFSKIKEAIKDGLIGQIINIEHSENVAYWHFPHGYVRGTWRRASESSPVILAKTCHDLDLLYWLVESKSKFVHSFGELTHYKPENTPKGAPDRCIEGCPIAEDCPWYSPRLYLHGKPIIRIMKRSKKRRLRFFAELLLNHRTFLKYLSYLVKPLKKLLEWKRWPATVITEDLSYEGKMKALKEGPWGRCVYKCDNDVPDHQIVSIQFENGVTASMTMHGHSFLDGRWIRISGSKGTLMGKFTYGGEKLVYHDHRYVKDKVLWEMDITFEAHSDGDAGLMESFVSSLLNEDKQKEALTSARESLESHIMGFAAEKSRLEKIVVNMDDMR